MAGGIQFSTADGAVYFVRDELLTACKLEGEELEGAQKDLGEEHENVVTDSTRYEAELPPLDFSAIGGENELRGSTVMCCW